tara:strand:- start:21792 stop:22736 length:945 start_codon:yes stop_codon:yes gene_type:complete
MQDIGDIDRAPVVFFCFCRIDETIKSIESLTNNYLAKDTRLYIFSDAARNAEEKPYVDAVRSYIRTISGFKSIEIYEAKTNKGLASSVIEGVSAIISRHGKVIVVEDDLVSSPNFLDFMNQALDHYRGQRKILSISGYSLDLNSLPRLRGLGRDIYFGYRASSWGWGTWRDRWFEVDWDLSSRDLLKKDRSLSRRFKRGGSDMPKMLNNQLSGRIDSWAIRFCFHQAYHDQLTVFPCSSKIESIGFGGRATHTFSEKRFQTELDVGDQREFVFEEAVYVDPVLAAEFRSNFSYCNRLMNRIRSSLNRALCNCRA